MVKNPPANAGDAGDMGLVSDQEDPLEKEMATCSSILAWEIPWTEEPVGPGPWGLRVGHAYTLLSSVKLHELRQRSALVTDKVELPTLPNSPLFLPKGSTTYLRRSWPVTTFVSRDTAQAVRRGSLRAHVLS